MERYDLFHYQPMLVLQKQLWQQLVADPNPATFFKWIMKNIDGKYLADDDFTRVLFRWLVHFSGKPDYQFNINVEELARDRSYFVALTKLLC